MNEVLKPMEENHEPAYKNKAFSLDERVDDLLGRMTVDEKLAQLNAVWLSEISEADNFSTEKAKERISQGIGQITRPAGSGSVTPKRAAEDAVRVQKFLKTKTRLGIPAIIHEECASGFMARRATIFPQIIGLASTWDADLVQAVTDVIRQQIRAVGGHQGLAPILDINRDARWGRAEETFGEDPYLTARLGTAYVAGLQGKRRSDLRTGVAATGKHFAAHGIPESGLNWAPVHVGERMLREVYLHPFEAAIKEAGLAGIMNAYHELDGVPCAASRRLLTEILRDEWGFEGIVVSDYNAIVMLADYHRVAADKSEAACQALTAGIDIELPGIDCYGEPLAQGVKSGKPGMDVVDTAVGRILALKFRLGLFDDGLVDPERSERSFGKPEQAALARRAAQESIVLLKNEAQLLPLNPDLESIAVIGPNADKRRHMVGDYSYASFSALIEGGEMPPESTRFPERYPDSMISVLEAIQKRVSPRTRVSFAPGCEISGTDRDSFSEAIEAANLSDVTVMVMGGKSGLREDCTSGELRDRASLGLTGVQSELVRAVVETGKPVVLVLVDGRPAAIPELVDQVGAAVEAWLPGEQGGHAVAEVLFGDINPGGKLPVSFPRSAGQIPVYYGRKPSGGKSYNFWDYVDLSASPLFPFGHGLSYTQFEYSDLVIQPVDEGVEAGFRIACVVKNSGDRTGDEVVQLYIHDVLASVTRPVKELKGFQRLTLQPGQSCQVTFTLYSAQLAFYDGEMAYVIEPGEFEVMVGSSSEDIRLQGTFKLVVEKTAVREKVFFSQCEVNLIER